MTPGVIEAGPAFLEHVILGPCSGERLCSRHGGAHAFDQGRKGRDGSPLSVVFRHHSSLALDFLRGELPLHDLRRRADIAEPLQDGLSQLVEPVKRKLEMRQREGRGNVGGEKAAGFVVDVSSFIGVGDDRAGREGLRDRAQGDGGRGKLLEQMNLDKVRAVGPRQALERSARSVDQGAGGLLKAPGGIGLEASVQAFGAKAWGGPSVANTTREDGSLWSNPPRANVSSSGWATKISGRVGNGMGTR